MGPDVTSTNRQIRAQAGVQPSKGQTGKAEASDRSTKCMRRHEQSCEAADKNTYPEVEPTRPAMQRKVSCAQAGRELKRAERERDSRSKYMGVDADALRFERRSHIRVDRYAQRKKTIDSDRVARNTECEEDERKETG